MRSFIPFAATAALLWPAATSAAPAREVIRGQEGGGNLLKPDAWRPWVKGFTREGDAFVCDNGDDARVQRGASQTVVLNQREPKPIVAVAWSKAQNVGPGGRNDYSLYLDLIYMDGTPLWGQTAPFSAGSHDWERRQVVVVPAKPVKSVAFHLLLRRRKGKAWFRKPALRVIQPPRGACLFDGIPVKLNAAPRPGFLARDAAAESDFFALAPGRPALGLRLKTRKTRRGGATFIDATLTDLAGKDRAITLVYTLPLPPGAWRWLADAYADEPTAAPSEYLSASRFSRVGATRLSRYPFAAVRLGRRGQAIGIDMDKPAVFRVFYAAGTRELAVAYDLGLAPEKPSARVRLCVFPFDAEWGFRAALQKYYDLFPDYFRCRTPKQGLWMPFAKISQVQGWRDFGFQFKEGTNETAWDDAHGITTFRYTEPHTWWMRMPKDTPRTMKAALAIARRRAAKGDQRAQAFFPCAYFDEHGGYCARFADTPWCVGAVWSISSLPGIPGDVTDFKLAWNPDYVATHYGPKRKADLDGEYVDSSEGYVTAELDFRRSHFKAARTPLTYDFYSRRPAIFRGLVSYEYVKTLARNVHALGKLMMANSTPSRLCWLAPWLDVLGTETNWNPGGKWRPMSHRDLIYRRSICGPKPFCFLMNTHFRQFPHERVERYMKRCLAYGMFPGFFSHNASQGHYFKRPELYNRDRDLFKKYVPLCKLVAEAGWRPITLAHASDPNLLVERFGDRYLTAFNAATKAIAATITLQGLRASAARDLVSGRAIPLEQGALRVSLSPEDVAVIELQP